MKLIILNGPPKSGKDSIANMLCQKLTLLGYPSLTYKFAHPLKNAVASMFSLSHEEKEYFFETAEKDLKQSRFMDNSPREVLISFSEDWAKRKFGKEVFGLLAGQELSNLNSQFFIISDCGFIEELEGLWKYIGPQNCILYNVHRLGCNFSNDSRSFIKTDKVRLNATLENNKTIEDACEAVLNDLEDLQVIEGRLSQQYDNKKESPFE